MSRLVVEHDVDSETAAVILAPRGDVVIEAGDIASGFTQVEGPFERYQRTVDVTGTSPDGRQQITETFDFRLDVPIWRPLVSWLMKRALRDPDRRPRARWWWPEAIVSRNTARLIAVITILSVMAGYLGVVISQTMTFAGEEFGSTKAEEGDAFATMRVGVGLSLLLIGRADRIGRKPLLIAFAGSSIVFTALGALSPSLGWLTAAQAIARGLDTGLLTLVGLAVVEEVPAKIRATVLGVMTMCTGLGSGMVVWALPLADLGPRAWRWIYVIPLVFLPILWWCWRVMPETRRFVVADEVKAPERINRKRFALIAVTAFASTLYLSPASQFQNDFLRDEQGYSAAEISLFRLLISTPVGIPILAAGYFADRRGRKPIGGVGVALGALASLAAYFSGGVLLWVFSAASIWLLAAAFTVLRSYSTELFPTRSRARVGGWMDVIGVSGSVVGLLVVGRLATQFGSFGPALSVMIFGPLLTAFLVLFFYPETASKELEEFNESDPTLAGPTDGR